MKKFTKNERTGAIMLASVALICASLPWITHRCDSPDETVKIIKTEISRGSADSTQSAEESKSSKNKKSKLRKKNRYKSGGIKNSNLRNDEKAETRDMLGDTIPIKYHPEKSVI